MNKEKSQYHVLKHKVTSAIDGSSDKVTANVIIKLSEPIIEERRDLLIAGMDALEKAEKELPEIKPDVKMWPTDKEGNMSGTMAPPVYSEQQAKKKLELEKRIEQLHEAFNKAIPSDKNIPDYTLLKKLVGGKK